MKVMSPEEWVGLKLQGEADIRDGVRFALYFDEEVGTVWGPVEVDDPLA